VLEAVGLPDMDISKIAPPPAPSVTPSSDDSGTAAALPTDKLRPAIKAKKDAATKVYEQESKDFPPAAMAWMHHASWKGPVDVPLGHIDWSADLMDGVEPDKVESFVKMLESGVKMKPVVLVKTPSGAKMTVVDGNHRFLAYAEMKQPVCAYIATVDRDSGPWETMHDQQYTRKQTGNSAFVKKTGSDDLAHLLQRVLSDGYMPIETAGRI
jgi:hypothetical protein